MPRRISDERKAVFYIGTAVQMLGVLLFLSVFVSAFLSFGNPLGIISNASSTGFRALGGIVLMIAGGGMRTVGARGLAGSGVLLDPEQAREDLEPYSRMAGGMVKDAMTEADIDLSGKPERIIMIRCTSCDALCQESANFCQQCGAKL